jgi:hypothetical protein
VWNISTAATGWKAARLWWRISTATFGCYTFMKIMLSILGEGRGHLTQAMAVKEMVETPSPTQFHSIDEACLLTAALPKKSDASW